MLAIAARDQVKRIGDYLKSGKTVVGFRYPKLNTQDSKILNVRSTIRRNGLCGQRTRMR